MTIELKAEGLEVVDPCADTVRVRVLPESVLHQHSGSAAPERSFDPYSTGVEARTVRPKPRRTLDDMRRLSEAIVRNRLRSK